MSIFSTKQIMAVINIPKRQYAVLNKIAELSERERSVIVNIVAGRNMSEIARIVKLSSSTVAMCRNGLAVKRVEVEPSV